MAPGSRASSLRRLSQPLPMIIEDIADIPPGVPPKSPRRPPVSNRSSIRSMGSLAAPSYNSSLTTAPPVNVAGSATPVPLRSVEKGEVLQAEDVQHPNNLGPVARRGWYRTLLTVLLVVGIVVGLSVGLTIGLRKRNENTSPPPLPVDIFPAGSFTFTTALTNVSTACSAAASSPSSSPWRCFPYALYSPSSPLSSSATYHWTIFPVTQYAYAISSSSNPFAPSFTNVSLSLLDANQPTERLGFSFIHPKLVSSQIGSRVLKCWFNTTVLSATIWTRRRASYPANITSATLPLPPSSSTSSSPSPTAGTGKPTTPKDLWPAWPFAVQVEEAQGASDEVPDCFDGATGQRVLLSSAAAPDGSGRNSTAAAAGVVAKRQDGAQCRCLYKNFDLPEGKEEEEGAANNGDRDGGRNESTATTPGSRTTATNSGTIGNNPTISQAPPARTETQIPAPIPTTAAPRP